MGSMFILFATAGNVSERPLQLWRKAGSGHDDPVATSSRFILDITKVYGTAPTFPPLAAWERCVRSDLGMC